MAHLAHYKEAHPLPMVITHWVNLICMVVLILTGIIIHFPYIPGIMGICRGFHIACGFIIFINCIIRIIMAFTMKTAPTGGTREQITDIKTWLPQADNKHQGIYWVKYYLFLKKDHPLGAKLGVPQKLSYIAIPFLIIIQFFTGLCIWAPIMDWGIFGGANALVGGAMSMRIIHYFIMFIFIIFMFIHIYLANVEGTEPTKLMFFHKEHGGMVYDPNRHVIIGYDDLKNPVQYYEGQEPKE